MKLFRSASAALLLGMQVFACVAACGQLKSFAKTSTEVSTDRFKLLSEGDQFFLSFHSPKGVQRILIRKEWLAPPAEVAEEEGDVVSSFVYSEHVTSFPIGNGELALKFSSYDIQPEGSMQVAAGRDVFLIFNPANHSLRPGLVDLGITKQRHREEGCFFAVMNHFLVADVNDDGLKDIGVVTEEIRCPDEGARLTGQFYVQHFPRWYLFSLDGWKRELGDSSWTDDYVELPLVGISTSPVDFVGLILWHSYDPTKWTTPPLFIPSYRKELMVTENPKSRSHFSGSSEGNDKSRWPPTKNPPAQPNR
jgi:hypothetical protein